MSASAAFQTLTPQSVRTALSTKVLGRTLHVLDETLSTNTAALALAQERAPHGTVVVAETQTAGRGRLGRQWYSPPNKNLYCSAILRSAPAAEQQALWLSWIPLIAALAAARAVQVAADLRPSVKWPNDILIGQRKLGGVLCESGGIGSPNAFVVVGIGLNVNVRRDEFPEELQDLATSMAAEAGRPFDRATLLATLLSELEIRHESFLAGRQADILNEYVLRCSTLGKLVRVDLTHEQRVEGYANSIAPDGSLQIKLNHGTLVSIRAGDVVYLR